jgi:hypothetical protein
MPLFSPLLRLGFYLVVDAGYLPAMVLCVFPPRFNFKFFCHSSQALFANKKL